MRRKVLVGIVLVCLVWGMVPTANCVEDETILWAKEGYYAEYSFAGGKPLRWEVRDVESDYAMVKISIYGGSATLNDKWHRNVFRPHVNLVSGTFIPYIPAEYLKEFKRGNIPERFSSLITYKYIGKEIVDTPLGAVRCFHIHTTPLASEEDHYFDYNTGILVAYEGEIKDMPFSQQWYGVIKETNIPIAYVTSHERGESILDEEASTPTTEEKETPGFEAVFAIAGLLAIAYILSRR